MTLTRGQIAGGRYRIVSLLGQGGMGAVYRAWDTRLNVLVALKEMLPQPGLDPHTLAQLREQFRQEAQVLARLNHPHLVRVTDFFEEGGNAYLVMDFVEGESLADRIARQGALPEGQVLVWAQQLLDGLAYCHAQGVIHRDIKPQNIIIRPDGRAVLVDFGLVKLWDPGDPRTRTAMRGVGTPEYAPPEQYDAATGHTDARSDIYSLGATLYHALTGRAPITATMRMAAPDEFAPLRAVAPWVSERTAAAVTKALELARDHRWPSAANMAQALGLPISGEVGQPSPPLVVPLSKPRRRVWVLSGVAALGVLGVVCAIVVAFAWSGIVEGRGTVTPTAPPTVTATTASAPAVVPTHTPQPTNTVPPGAPTSTPRPTNTPTPTRRPPTPTFTPTPTPTAPPPPPPSPPEQPQPPQPPPPPLLPTNPPPPLP